MPLKQPPFTLPTHLLFFILVLSCFVFSYQQVCNHQDQSALLAFSKSISTSSSLLSNWSSQVSCCQWEGVECDINGRVIHLHLPSRGLKGLISSSIISLTNLRVMDLSSNSISGSIPQEIGKLLYLEKLHLFGNNLGGPIPSSLMNCAHLVEIILRDNHLNGDISKLDFSRLVQLQKLDLRNNSFNGTLPESTYSSCKSLVAYRVELNNITGQISPKIAELKSLSFLSIAQNSFSNITMALGVLAKCKNLSTLFLSSNFYGESLPVHRNFISLGEFPKLQFLNLRNCMFAEGPIPNWLSNLRSLRVLNLEGNRFTGRVPNWLRTLPNLFRLNLNNNSLYGEFPLSLCQLPALISQDEANPNLSQFELPVFFSIVNTYIRSKVDNYYGLGLSYNAFSGNIPEEIGSLQNLQQLYLNNNQFSGLIPISISRFKKLEYLDLSTNNLTGEIPTSLASLSFLSHFNVSYNHLEGPIPTGTQFYGFEESSFEGNPGLFRESLTGSCSNIPATSKEIDRHGKHQFLDGLFVGFASGFSSILFIAASYYVWFNYCQGQRRRPSSRRG